MLGNRVSQMCGMDVGVSGGRRMVGEMTYRGQIIALQENCPNHSVDSIARCTNETEA